MFQRVVNLEALTVNGRAAAARVGEHSLIDSDMTPAATSMANDTLS